MDKSCLQANINTTDDVWFRHAEQLVERRRFRQPRGMFPSEKLRGPVSWTSLYQRDAMIMLELQDQVVSYEAWPVAVELRIGRETVTYHPSLGMTLQGGRKIALDLFAEGDCTLDERRSFEAVLAPALAEAGYGLVRMGERALQAGRCLANARAVVRAAGLHVGDDMMFLCMRQITSLGNRATLDQLATADARLSCAARILAMRRMLTIDLHAERMGQCILSIPVGRPR